MNPEFFYRLGHCRDLAVAELESLTNNSQITLADNWLITESNINVNKTGSLVFGGIILGKLPNYLQNKDKKSFNSFLEEYLVLENEIHEIKKVGIALPVSLSNNVISIAKKAKFKKINVLKDKMPNFGNWRGIKSWYIVFFVKNDLVLGKIDTYFDQQFFARLDMKLPVTDMRRGQINLKLARSLVNLNSQKSIWDPFCGVGRITAASMNLKKQFINSDLDEKAIQDTETNLQFNKEYWQTKIKRPVAIEPAFQLDAREINKVNLKNINLNHVGISTEGFLGHNFNKLPTTIEKDTEWEKIERIWVDTLQSSEKVGIPEIVFCIPFYQNKSQKFLPEFLGELTKKTNYELAIFPNNKNYILYSRADSFVGHMILKATKK